MEIYQDYELNKIANEIRDEIEEIDKAMAKYLGQSANINSNRAKEVYNQVMNEPIKFARDLLDRNQHKLQIIRSKIGYQDKYLLELNDALALMVSGILNFPLFNIKMSTSASDFKRFVSSDEGYKMKLNLTETACIINDLVKFRISQDILDQISEQTRLIKQLEIKFNPSSGCYIATAVYDDYNSPEVIKLRLFRDKYLNKSNFGRYLIDKYYEISPKLVLKYSDNQVIKLVCKRIISFFIKFI